MVKNDKEETGDGVVKDWSTSVERKIHIAYRPKPPTARNGRRFIGVGDCQVTPNGAVHLRNGAVS